MNLLAAISKSVAVEFKKSRHKHSLLLLVIAVVLNYFYLFHGNKPDRQAWYNVFFAIPMINTLILSVLMAVLASQSVDMEHKATCGISCRHWKAEHLSISASSSTGSYT